MNLSLLTLVGALATVLALPGSLHVLHEKRDAEPRAWIKIEPVHVKTVLPMRIGLVSKHVDPYKMLMEVSSPTSPSYGKHYTPEEIINIFAPKQHTVDAVRTWLESSGIKSSRISHSVNKQWIQFDAETGEVERLLKTKYHVYGHMASGRTNIACDEYHVPEHIQEHVDYITPGIKLATHSGLPTPNNGLQKRTFIGRVKEGPLLKPMPAMMLVQGQSADLCDVIVTPQCIATMYNITNATLSAEGNELGIFEDLGDIYAQEDLNDFFTALYPGIPNGTSPVLQSVDGGTAPTDLGNAGAESALDLQIAYPIIYPQKIKLFQTDDPVYEANYQFQGFLNNLFDAIDGSYCSFSAFGETGNSELDPPYPNPAEGGFKGALQCGVYKAPNVMSISYGGAEADLPIPYQRRQCAEIAKLGMQGVSVVASSGDSGVAGRGGDPRPSNCLGEKDDVFAPDFPASCPFITAVGATFLPVGASVAADAEIAVTRFPSGGGFSNIYNRSEATWQREVVEGYLAKKLVNYTSYESTDNSSFNQDGGIFNRIGRAYPDVAAIGDNVAIFVQGASALIGGTSASAPVFGALLNRVNEERIAAGKSTVGFVNPILYAHPEVFNDITVGSNPGCNTTGFLASEGWDPVTGLGTPNYPALLKLFMDQP